VTDATPQRHEQDAGPSPIAVIVRFDGDPEDLLERFERARRLWTDAQDADCSRPVFYATCKTDTGIAILNAWETEAAHQTFAHRMGPHLESVGMGMPDQLERLRIGKLSWD
jgi:hypothetical protein